MSLKKVVIMGAAGRDFHNFNLFFRDNKDYEVVAFTATQIPDIAGRKYPAELAGKLYPKGIPIFDEKELPKIMKDKGIDLVVFSYSDIAHEDIMHKASLVLAEGVSFMFLGPKETMVKSKKPVISICAVRTGCGKSQTTRRVSEILRAAGKKVVAIRHPMPYGDLAKQKVQRFATLKDLDKHKCTIEEREEYEPHIMNGVIVYAGVDYEAILREAEKEADVVLWDGGNNDTPFYKSDLEIVVVDPHRPGHEVGYHPGETNTRRADVIVINKVDTADIDNIDEVRYNVNAVNPRATVIEAASPLSVSKPMAIRGKKVLVVEDGPTLTHGEMAYGAGVMAARKYGAAELVDPRPYAVASIQETYRKYPDIGILLPAMGYGDKQVKDLETTINKTKCDLVVIATPIDLSRIIKINKPTVRVEYSLSEIGRPNLEDVLEKFI
ncbi:MAG TPA: cyclic 2,3-diphosphoglycerate synthase [Acidobacteriota bacterium]|nr:cyclic 2,3-diphosphoglycerate synthase [Acidobacteriota bacterium]HQO20839.1 cyclic 2,3-diphosphoglycerate synthase [Acidobacteriota bacterium]HQQ47673.1 cyclic 2,3-diphosphoglycerate synthase [Acidobacteriota bacterium]